jgi:hypothetical protein
VLALLGRSAGVDVVSDKLVEDKLFALCDGRSCVAELSMCVLLGFIIEHCLLSSIGGKVDDLKK